MAGRAAARAALDELGLAWRIAGFGRMEAESPEFPVRGNYFVSSDRGLFVVGPNEVRKISGVPCFGIARAGDDIYLATWTRRDSRIIKGRFRSGETRVSGAREIFRVPTLTDAGRIHQVGVWGDALWICNTAANTLTKIDRHDGTFLANVAPFRCSFGHPITGDHNHLNSVFPQERWLLFGAFKINRRSAFGLIGEGRYGIWAYRNMGIHDCIVRGDEFWFSDSYRFWDGVGGRGCVYRDREIFDAGHFDREANLFVRGIAGNGDEYVFGNSHAGDRTSRFLGRGNLLLGRDGRITHRVEFPGSQVYDVIRQDGRHFDVEPAPREFGEMSMLMTRVFGEAVESGPLSEVLVGRAAKKFDDSDVGSIAEYL